MNVKKLVLTNLPYVVLGLVCTNLGEAWRMSSGSDASEKILSLFGAIPAAFGNPLPSFHALDLLVGLACGLLLRLAVYLRGKTLKNTATGTSTGQPVGELLKIYARTLTRCSRTTSYSRRRKGSQ